VKDFNTEEWGMIGSKRKQLRLLELLQKISTPNHTPFLYVETHGGDGLCIDEKRVSSGSPLISAKFFRKSGIKFKGVISEINPENADSLRCRLQSFPEMKVVTGACENIDLGEINFPRKSYGLIYSDPCGADIPWKKIHEWVNKYPNMDVLINIPIKTCMRRGKLVEDKILSMGKKHTYVGGSLKNKNHMFTFFLFTNRDLNVENIWLHNIRSDMGRVMFTPATSITKRKEAALPTQDETKRRRIIKEWKKLLAEMTQSAAFEALKGKYVEEDLPCSVSAMSQWVSYHGDKPFIISPEEAANSPYSSLSELGREFDELVQVIKNANNRVAAIRVEITQTMNAECLG
jgi:hypothetical protein